MKKFLFLSLIFSAMFSTTLLAQNAGPSAMTKPSPESVKPQMMEVTGLTSAQVDRVLEVNLEIRLLAGDMSNLSEADRTAKIKEIMALKEKKYSEIPLTGDQIKAVYTFYQDMRKNMQQKAAN